MGDIPSDKKPSPRRRLRWRTSSQHWPRSRRTASCASCFFILSPVPRARKSNLTNWPAGLTNCTGTAGNLVAGHKSERIRHKRSYLFLIRPARMQLHPRLQNDGVLSVHNGLDFLDPREVHNDRPMNALERGWIERFLQGAHGRGEEVARPPHVKLDVVLGGLDPIDLLDIHEERL